MDISWKLKKFEELTGQEVYGILQLRMEVFVVEQHCVFQDADDKDQGSYHLCGYINNELAAYTRLVPPGLIYSEPSIGRVVTSPKYRKKGLGMELMQQSILHAKKSFGEKPIKIGAQLYLQRFYESLGFKRISDIYLDDGIEHIYMLLTV